MPDVPPSPHEILDELFEEAPQNLFKRRGSAWQLRWRKTEERWSLKHMRSRIKIFFDSYSKHTNEVRFWLDDNIIASIPTIRLPSKVERKLRKNVEKKG